MGLSEALMKQAQKKPRTIPQRWQQPQYNHDRDQGLER
ncbi:hypothetical protein FM102_11125 [Corynebacterium glutamicum]|nr:hypothetical protein FM102_11125 [Corynebacterium glutamicum]